MSDHLIIEGKTKQVFADRHGMVRVVAKDDITAGDGARKDSFAGKGILATRTNRNVFELLSESNIPVAYEETVDEKTYRARRCNMLPYEVVVVRQVAEKSSMRKRIPGLETGTRFDALKVFFFLKTTGPTFRGIDVPKDDPLITKYWDRGITVAHPHQPISDRDSQVLIQGSIVFGEGAKPHPFKEMEELARRVFLVLEKAWRMYSNTLLDLKIEFGYDVQGNLLVSDVITNDEWRLLDHLGRHRDKQLFRDNAPMGKIIDAYVEVAEVSDQFRGLNGSPGIFLWRESEQNSGTEFELEWERLGQPCRFDEVVCSAHTATRRALDELSRIANENGTTDVVIIAYAGSSNLGALLKGNTIIPVIYVPVAEKEVMSSLCLPLDVPLLTVLNPANAVQAAVEMLAFRSPYAYMARRYVLESHWLDSENSPSFGKDF